MCVKILRGRFLGSADPKLGAVWREPCVALVSGLSLRAGPGVQLLQRWGQDPKSVLVLADSLTAGDSKLALGPLGPLKMKVVSCPPRYAGWGGLVAHQW